MVIRIAALGLLATLSLACSDDGAESADGRAVDSTYATSPSVRSDSAGAAIDSGAGGNGSNTNEYSTEPTEIVRRMSERFVSMGGMEGVVITVTDGGGVVLSGIVPTSDRKQTAEDVARVIAGNVPVENRLEVRK